jgi:hypothetical protein
VTNPVATTRKVFSPNGIGSWTCDDDLEPYLSLFQKPLTNKKSEFSKQELEVMCRDPLHSPRLIHYLIDFVKEL